MKVELASKSIAGKEYRPIGPVISHLDLLLEAAECGDDKKKAAGAVDALLRKNDAHGCPGIVLPLICAAAGCILIVMAVKSKFLSVLVDPKDPVPRLRDASII